MPTLLQHAAASLFSTAVFRPLLAGESLDRATRATTRLRAGLTLPSQTTNASVVSSAYDYLRTLYRSEYYYRNLITNKLFVGRHHASGAVLLNEFRVGASVADQLGEQGHHRLRFQQELCQCRRSSTARLEPTVGTCGQTTTCGVPWVIRCSQPGQR